MNKAVKEIRKNYVRTPFTEMDNDHLSIVLSQMVKRYTFEMSADEKQMLFASMKGAVQWADRSNYSSEEWIKEQARREKVSKEEADKMRLIEDRARKIRHIIIV